tara:strand:+ start:1197 stop:1505 length:309 start_codon:yes stop_codon:yes gene_type:complete
MNLNKNTKNLFLLLLACMLFSACADGFNQELVNKAIGCTRNEESGFWFGLLNGMTAGFAFLYSLFDDSVSCYDVCNNGRFYWLGFLLGVGAFTGAGKATISE